LYDADYFENGIATGKSCYMNYRWMPELTIKMTHCLIKHLQLKESDRVLDYGCAKGFMVKAFRILDIPAFGCDISPYAIDNSDADIRHFCTLIKSSLEPIPFDFNFDWIITKDVLEHMEEKDLDRFLECSLKKTNRAFHVIPLADKYNNFIVPEYNKDITHVMVKDVSWWKKKFESFGWTNSSFSYHVRGIKDIWVERYKYGNGFFLLEKKKRKGKTA
jgi:cyclopropane fatty-acyl-phospholipid synthase-like methyltransferase